MFRRGRGATDLHGFDRADAATDCARVSAFRRRDGDGRHVGQCHLVCGKKCQKNHVSSVFEFGMIDFAS